MSGFRAKPPKGAKPIPGLADRLRLSFLLNEKAGPKAYDAGGTLNGVISGGATWQSGGWGAELALNGTSGQIDCGDVVDNVAEISVVALVKFTSLASTFRGIVCKADGINSAGESYFLSTGGNVGGGLTSAAQVRFRPNTDTDTTDTTAKNAYTATLSTGVWYHLIGSWRASDGLVRMYLNGIPQTDGTKTGSVIRNTNGTAKFGNSGYGEYLPGSIAGAWLYSRFINPAEARALAADPFRPFRRRRVVILKSSVTNTPLTASPGSFAATGTAVILAVGLGAAPGTFTETGSPATLGVGLGAGVGVLALSGSPAAFALAVGLGAGAFSLTGVAAALGQGLAASPGGFVETGSAAPLGVGLSAGAGSALLAGSPAGFALTLNAGPGSFALTGVAATLIAGGNASLNASPGSFAATGSPAPLGVGLGAAPGAVVASGSPAAFALAAPLSPGSLTLTGSQVAFAVTLGTGPGSFALTGAAASLVVGGNVVLSAGPGAFGLTGFAATLVGTGLPVGRRLVFSLGLVRRRVFGLPICRRRVF